MPSLRPYVGLSTRSNVPSVSARTRGPNWTDCYFQPEGAEHPPHPHPHQQTSTSARKVLAQPWHQDRIYTSIITVISPSQTHISGCGGGRPLPPVKGRRVSLSSTCAKVKVQTGGFPSSSFGRRTADPSNQSDGAGGTGLDPWFPSPLLICIPLFCFRSSWDAGKQCDGLI